MTRTRETHHTLARSHVIRIDTCGAETHTRWKWKTLSCTPPLWACSAGYKPTLLQLFGLLQLQSIERKIL
jgi:hypothetical protein